MRLDRRAAMKAAIASGVALGAGPAAAQAGAPSGSGPKVWLDMDQAALNKAFDQSAYAPNLTQIVSRFVTNSQQMRERLGPPERIAYGPNPAEQLDLYKAARPKAPILVFIHGGAWRSASALDYGFFAEMVLAAGAHVVIPDFSWVQDVGGDLFVLAGQVRRALAWTHAHARSFGGNRNRLFVGGHSSGGHLAGVLLTTDWTAFGLPATLIKGGVCIGGLYDLTPVRLSSRGAYINFTDAMTADLSPIRHIDRLTAPITLAYGGYESPEFQRQSRAFADVVKRAGKPVELLEGAGYNHFEMMETAANPFAVAGRAILQRMNLRLG
jgi:arylformamidase